MDNFLLWPRQAGAQTTAPSPTLSTPTPANQAGAFSTPDRASPSTWSSATSPNSSFSSSSSTVSTSTTSAASTSETLSTASTASSSTSDSTQTSDRSRGVSNGTLAGAIIGSIAGTAIVALLVAILYIRFRRNKEARTTQGASSTTRDTPKPLGEIQTQSRLPPVGTQEKEPSGTSSAPWSLLLNLSSYVPDPADDHAVCTRIQTLFDQAGLHVDNYYTPASPMVRPTQDAVARVNHYGSPFLPSSVATMLSKPRAQRPVLTHVLVRTLLNAIQPGMGTESLLPQPYASSPPHQGNAVFGSDKDRAIFAWRMLTAYLYKQDHSAEGGSTRNIEETALAHLTESFVHAFAPYSDAHFSETDRLIHFSSVAKAAADLGVWLFANPCFFDFRWSTSTTDRLTVLPAVVKITDEQGQRLIVPQVLVEETKVRV